MNSSPTSFERLAAETTLAFLRSALDSLACAEHFAATARLPKTYLDLQTARQSLDKTADHLMHSASTVVPIVRQTCPPGGAKEKNWTAPAGRQPRAQRPKAQRKATVKGSA